MEVSPEVRIGYIIYYCVVFTAGFLGNALIIVTVFKYRKMRTVVNLFLTNLAVADIMFVLLSLFDAIAFIHNNYNFGDVICRLQSGLIEVSYTVSVLTLSSVAVERYIAICRPYTKKRTKRQCYVMILCIWLFSVAFCAVLFYGYATDKEDGKRVCANTYWTSTFRLTFYIIHSVVVYLFPLLILIISHYKISQALTAQERRLTFSQGKLNKYEGTLDVSGNVSGLQDKSITNSEKELYLKVNKKQEKVKGRGKVVRLLAIVTLIFFILWTPFILIRQCMYAGVTVPAIAWRGSQLLMFGNTAVNVFIYSFMSPSFRTSFKLILMCRKQQNAWSMVDSSRSLELSETLKSKIEVTHLGFKK